MKMLLTSVLIGVAVSSPTKNYPPNDPNLYYSPFAWHVSRESAATINAGSYMRFLASASVLSFRFDVSHMPTPASQVYWRVDNGPQTMSLVQDTVAVMIPPNNTGILYHSIELFVKSTTERANRWKASGNSTRIILTGIETDGSLAPWIPSDVNLLIYGDSITEGVQTLGSGHAQDTDNNDATIVYSHMLGRLLGAETGVIGFGYSGLTHEGSGGVVALGDSWNQLWEGVPRDFTNPKPDLIILNEGTNDGCDVTKPGCIGANSTTALLAAVLKKLVVACPDVPIAVLEPFNGAQVEHLKAAVSDSGSDYVHYIDTTGFYNLKYGGTLHPSGPNDVAQVAPKIAQKLRPLLAERILARNPKHYV